MRLPVQSFGRELMRLSLGEIGSRLNASYWFVPLVVTLGGVVLAVLLIQIDSPKSLHPGTALTLLYPNSAEGSRALLSAVIGAIITALSVTFSVTIVALTVAAQHFGPRVLNNFVRHTSAQLVLGTFMATFIYAVLVLGAIEGTGTDANGPDVAVGGAVVLVILSVGALIFYVHHIATSLQIGELTGEIAADFRRSMKKVAAHPGGPAPGEADRIPPAPPDACRIAAVETGYVQRIDHQRIVTRACEADAVVWIRREPGAFVIAGTPLALVHPPAACDDTLTDAVREACIVGSDRTLWQDPEFAVKQLVEVALRALSPGVNEPFTAITCIDRLAESLARVLAAPEPRASWGDANGRARVYTQPQPFSTLLRAAFDPIRIFAGSNPAIYARLLESLTEIALLPISTARHAELRHQVEVIHRTAERCLAEADDREFVQLRYERALQQLNGEPTSMRR